MNRPFALLALAALLSAALTASPLLLEYTFDSPSAPLAGTGRLAAPLRGVGDLPGLGGPGSGVSGRPSDRAWDSSGNSTQGAGLPPNRSALVASPGTLDLARLQAFTLSFWFKTQQSFAGDSATRFVMQSDRPTEPVSQGLVLRVVRGGLELRLGAVSPEAEGTPVEVVAGSVRFREGSGYHRADTWVFVAVTWDGKDIRFHVADAASPVSPAGSAPFVGRILDDPGPLTFGNSRAFNRGLDGWMDNIRLHEHALDLPALETLRRSDLGRP